MEDRQIYRDIEYMHRTHRLFYQWPPEVMRWLATRVMICGLLRTHSDNEAIAKALKEAGVRLLQFDEGVDEFWAARQIMHRVWDPTQESHKIVLDLLVLFREVPEELIRTSSKSDTRLELEDQVIGARRVYRKHLVDLAAQRNSIEERFNKYFA